MKVNTTGLATAAVLAALYNASKPQGMGFLHYRPGDMTEAEAQGEIDARKKHCHDLGCRERISFDYLHGRVMKVDLTDPDSFYPSGYDMDNGEGAAQRVIDRLRATHPVAA